LQVRPRFSRLDALLLLMTIIWGGNYSVVKSAISEVPEIAFNGIRLALASALFLAAVARTARRGGSDKSPTPIRHGSDTGPTRLSPRDWGALVALAFVGQFLYQMLFITGLARTSAANSALILGCTPVFVALLTAALGHEDIPRVRWAGVALSAGGIYLVVGHGAAVTRESVTGDSLMLGAVVCWSVATVMSRPLLARHSPLIVTGYSMAIGTLFYAPFALPELRSLEWGRVSAWTWVALISSATLALCIAYMIWFTAVQRIGNTRTSVYSNMVPVVAMVVAALGFGEPIGALEVAGAAAILTGVALARL
jgi:drug/metabolite transporter (DMT)-like permease